MSTVFLNSIVSNTRLAEFLCGDGGWWLWVTDFTEDSLDDFCFLYVEEEDSQLILSYQCKYIIDYHRKDVYCTIKRVRNSAWVWRRIWTFGKWTEGKVFSCLWLCVSYWEIDGITVDMEYHSTVIISHSGGIWIGGHIVEEVVIWCSVLYSCFLDPEVIAYITMYCWTKVPSIYYMWCPCFPLPLFVVYKNSCV